MALQESIVPEFTSISKPQMVAGLPSGYAILLFMAVTIMATVFGYILSAIGLGALLWVLGATVTWYDPYAWTLFARMNRVPKRLKP